MASYHPKRCKSCGVEKSDEVHISKAGLCPRCGFARGAALVAATTGLVDAIDAGELEAALRSALG